MRRDEDRFPFVAEVIKQIPDLLTVNRIKTHSRLSKNSSEGSCTNAQPIARSCRIPPERLWAAVVLFFLQINHAKQALDSRFKLSARYAIRATEEPEIFRHSKIG